MIVQYNEARGTCQYAISGIQIHTHTSKARISKLWPGESDVAPEACHLAQGDLLSMDECVACSNLLFNS